MSLAIFIFLIKYAGVPTTYYSLFVIIFINIVTIMNKLWEVYRNRLIVKQIVICLLFIMSTCN